MTLANREHRAQAPPDKRNAASPKEDAPPGLVSGDPVETSGRWQAFKLSKVDEDPHRPAR